MTQFSFIAFSAQLLRILIPLFSKNCLAKVLIPMYCTDNLLLVLGSSFCQGPTHLRSKQFIKKFHVLFDPQFICIVLKSISCVSPWQTWSYFGFSACTSTPTFIQEITDVRCQELETVTFEAVFAGTPMPGNPIMMNISY